MKWILFITLLLSAGFAQAFPAEGSSCDHSDCGHLGDACEGDGVCAGVPQGFSCIVYKCDHSKANTEFEKISDTLEGAPHPSLCDDCFSQPRPNNYCVQVCGCPPSSAFCGAW